MKFNDICNRYKRNYYCWTNRYIIIKECPSLIIDELLQNEYWIRRNVSDYSSMFYRIVLK